MAEAILVTGGAGFVGSHISVALAKNLERGQVTAFDNLSRAGSETNLLLLESHGVEFVRGDIRSAKDLAGLSRKPDLVIDCAAEPSAMAGYRSSPRYAVETNVGGTFECLELAREASADLLFISTSRVYPYPSLNRLGFTEDAERFGLEPEQEITGASGQGIAEDFPLDGPRSIYGTTKLVSEYLVEEYADAYGLRFVINRAGLITGPRQMAKSDQGVIVLWLAAHALGRPLRYIGFEGTGKQVRDVLHVDDFCDLILDQVRHFESYEGRRFNVGGGLRYSVSLRELTNLCREVTGNEIALTPDPETRPADVRIYLTDHRRVTAIRGWEPKRDVRSALLDIHAWLETADAQVKSVLLDGMT